MSWGLPVYHIFPVFTPHRNALQEHLQAAGVSTGIHYPIPAHLQLAHRDLGYKAGDLPHTEAASLETLSLPMYAELTLDARAVVADAIKRFDIKLVQAHA
jgi:dTDP-4-amino-4,6-dideoxygalactose transaminase